MTEEELEALRGLGVLTREEQVSSLTKQAREEMEFKNRQFVGKLGHKHFSVKPARHMALNHGAVHPSVVRHVRHANWLHNVVSSLDMGVCLLASFRQLMMTLLVEGDGTSLAETIKNREFAEFAECFREVANVTLASCVPCVSEILTEAIVGLRIAIGTVYPSLPRNSAARREKFGQPDSNRTRQESKHLYCGARCASTQSSDGGRRLHSREHHEQALLRRRAGEP